MRRLIVLGIASLALLCVPLIAVAQNMGGANVAPSGPATVTLPTHPQWDQSPPVTVTTAPPGGIINIGQAFGTVLQPYIDAVVQALIVAGVGWLAWFLKTRLNINIDQGQRDTLQAFLQNSANSLIAAGAVQMQGKTVTVRSEALAAEVNSAITRVPDALKHFGLDGPAAAKILEDKIMDAIPQTTAGAAIVAQAHADTSSPAAPAPVVAADRQAADPQTPAAPVPPAPVAATPVTPQPASAGVTVQPPAS